MPSKSEDQQPSFMHGRQPPLDNADEPEVARRPFEQESSNETSRSEVLDAPVGSFSPESTTKGPEDDLPSESGEDQPGTSTRAARSKQSPPYLIIGASLLVVVGAFAGQWILSAIPSFIIMRIPSTQSEG